MKLGERETFEISPYGLTPFPNFIGGICDVCVDVGV